MRRYVKLTLFSLLLLGLVSACSKKQDVAPSGPIVGQWDISRYTVTNLPSSYSSLNGTFSTGLSPDTYVFKNDGSYTNTQIFQLTSSTTSTNTEVGTWVLNGGTVSLTPKGQSSTYTLLYSASASELTTGPFTSTETLNNPTTGAAETISYTLEYVYKKAN